MKKLALLSHFIYLCEHALVYHIYSVALWIQCTELHAQPHVHSISGAICRIFKDGFVHAWLSPHSLFQNFMIFGNWLPYWIYLLIFIVFQLVLFVFPGRQSHQQEMIQILSPVHYLCIVSSSCFIAFTRIFRIMLSISGKGMSLSNFRSNKNRRFFFLLRARVRVFQECI